MNSDHEKKNPSLNALERILTGFKMDEIIREDLQVSGGLFDERSSTFGM